jgi:hypothetical protein
MECPTPGTVTRRQIIFLKSPELLPYREAVSAAVDSRHLQVRKLWTEMLAGIGVSEDKAA